MKHLLLASVLGVIAICPHASAQTIAYKGQTAGTSGPGNLDYNNDYNGTTYPFYAQFGVGGVAADVNPESPLLGGSTGVTVSPITVSDDAAGEQTQVTSNITFDYSNATSPQNSSTQVNGAPASEYSVQTGYGIGQISGQTLSFTVTFSQAFSAATFNLIANDYASTSTLTFTLNDPVAGSHSVSVNDPNPSAAGTGGNDNFWDDVSMTNIAAGDTLTITDEMTGTGASTAANISISGISFTNLTAAPEPSAYALMFGGVAVLLALLRFRNRMV